MSLSPSDDCPSQETGEEEETGKKESEVESVESEDLEVKIQYENVSKKPAKFPQLNEKNEITLGGTEKDLEWRSDETDKSLNTSILMKILPEEKQDDPPGAEEESRRSPKLWSLMENPSSDSRPEPEEKEAGDAPREGHQNPRSIGNEKMIGCGHMRGLGTLSFYNREYTVASKYIDNEFSAPRIQIHFHIDAALMRLECDIYRERCCEIQDRLECLTSHISSAATISAHDLLRWAEELRASNRHYGSFILCLAVAGTLPVKGANAGWYFNLCYYLFVEMSLRAVQVLRQMEAYSVITKFVLDCLDRMILKLKLFLPICNRSLGTAVSRNMKRKIAVCHLAISYCCNCARLNESAEKFTDAGIQIQSDDYFVRRDLLVNKTASFIARRKIDEAYDAITDASKIMQAHEEMDSGDCSRVKLITEMKDLIWKMMLQKDVDEITNPSNFRG